LKAGLKFPDYGQTEMNISAIAVAHRRSLPERMLVGKEK
jgi:hypothetical protein